MNQVKMELIKIINEIPDTEASTVEKLLKVITLRYQLLEGLEDVENGNVMTLEEFRNDVANWASKNVKY